MKLLKRVTVGVGVALLLGTTSVSAATYTVQSGDTLLGIAYKLGFDSVKAAGITSVPSGDLAKIFPGEQISYKGKHKKKSRFVSKEKINLKKFCFKNNHSIHYRAQERCK